MTLHKDTVAAAIDAVKADATCVSQIDSIVSTALPDALGLAGAVRNFGMAVVNTYSFNALLDPSEPSVEGYVCTGIAKATARAIDRALKSVGGDRDLALIESVSTITRSSPIDHTATLLQMKDKSSYVLDWHATLNVANPHVSTAADWSAAKGGWDFDSMPHKVLNGGPKALGVTGPPTRTA